MQRVVDVAWQLAFLRAVERHGGPWMTPRDLAGERALRPRLTMRGTDRQSRFNATLAFGLLGAADIMEHRHGIPRDEAVRIARAAFLDTGRGLTRAMMILWLRLKRDPFAALLRKTPMQRMRSLWGEGLEAEQEVMPDRIMLRVKGCAFAEFFWDAGRSDLAPILCAYDAAWFETVNQARQGLAVRRTGVLTEGAPACAFIFERRLRQKTSDDPPPVAGAFRPERP